MVEAWERQKGEPIYLHNIFENLYLSVSPEQRSYKGTYGELQKDATNSAQNNKKISLSTIEKAGARWNWIERAALYDANQQLKEMQKHEEEFTKENEKIINLIETLLDYCNETLKEIINNSSNYALTTRLSLISTLMGVIDRANYNIRTCFGKPAKYTDKLEFDGTVNQTVEEKPNIFNKSNKELDELLSINDDFNMEDFLEQQEGQENNDEE